MSKPWYDVIGRNTLTQGIYHPFALLVVTGENGDLERVPPMTREDMFWRTVTLVPCHGKTKIEQETAMITKLVGDTDCMVLQGEVFITLGSVNL